MSNSPGCISNGERSIWTQPAAQKLPGTPCPTLSTWHALNPVYTRPTIRTAFAQTHFKFSFASIVIYIDRSIISTLEGVGGARKRPIEIVF